MKTLELLLQKRLLIVERDDYRKNASYSDNGKIYSLKFICKGPELSDDLAKGLIIYDDVNLSHPDFVNEIPCLNHKTGAFEYYTKFSPLESFISAIEAHGYHWGKNPMGKEPYNGCSAYTDMYTIAKRARQHQEWQEAESRTFYPAKTLIFEII